MIELARRTAPSWSARVAELLARPPGRSSPTARRAILLAAALGPPSGARRLWPAREPSRPREAVALAAGARPSRAVLARALGAEWLDRYLAEWRDVELEIDGEDLIAAGVPEGPAVGRGLQEALRRKLDGEIAGRDAGAGGGARRGPRGAYGDGVA